MSAPPPRINTSPLPLAGAGAGQNKPSEWLKTGADMAKLSLSEAKPSGSKPSYAQAASPTTAGNNRVKQRQQQDSANQQPPYDNDRWNGLKPAAASASRRQQSRRSSLSAVHHSVGYFTRGLASTDPSLIDQERFDTEMLAAGTVDQQQRGPRTALPADQASPQPPPPGGWANQRPSDGADGFAAESPFPFGRFHRSFSVSSGASAEPQPQQQMLGRKSSSPPMPTMLEEQPLADQQQYFDPRNYSSHSGSFSGAPQQQQPQWEAVRLSGQRSPMLDSAQRQQLVIGRRSSSTAAAITTTSSSPLATVQNTNNNNSNTNNNNNNNNTNNGSNANDASARRFSITSGFLITEEDSQQIATQYFNKDPGLRERRRSIASSALGSPLMTRSPLLSAVTRRSQAGGISNEFAEQYGNFFDSPTLVNSTAGLSSPPVSSAAAAARTARQQEGASGDEMRLFVVEFKGGRNDLFYSPPDSKMRIEVGDLVIVEADRGKDLGKVTMANFTDISDVCMESGTPVALMATNAGANHNAPQTPVSATPRRDSNQSSSASDSSAACRRITPKLIFGHASPVEVNMLLDKSRDEGKALSICQAKSRQKKLPMEVIDAEYQWDRKKLTFYFVAESRIDFRELVKDLFKIYKTRIWMCAVERNGNSRLIRAPGK